MVTLSINAPPRTVDLADASGDEAPVPPALARGDADLGRLRRLHRSPLRGTALIGSLVEAIDGATITAAIAAIEIFLLRTRWDRPLQQASFLVTFGVKWLAYGMVITAVNERSPARGCSARPWVPPRSRGSSCWGYPFPVLLGSSG